MDNAAAPGEVATGARDQVCNSFLWPLHHPINVADKKKIRRAHETIKEYPASLASLLLESLRSSWNRKIKVTSQRPFKVRNEVPHPQFSEHADGILGWAN